MNISKRVVAGNLLRAARRVGAVAGLAAGKFFRMDGAQWAAAFAFNVFFSLFPLILLLVTIASFFVDEERAGKVVIDYLQNRAPISGEMERQITDTIGGVIEAREQAGVIALVVLLWASLRSFTTLIRATNHAWGLARYNWWRLPLRSLLLLGSTAGAVLLGLAAPMLERLVKSWLVPARNLDGWIYESASFLFPLGVVFLGLSLFYRFAPRRPTRFAEVWAGALCATLLLRAAEALLVVYLKDFANLNALYGAFGGLMALLLWIYISGCVFIFGACLCASRSEVLGQPVRRALAKAGNTPFPRAVSPAIVRPLFGHETAFEVPFQTHPPQSMKRNKHRDHPPHTASALRPVRFEYFDQAATNVAIAGTFNDWQPAAKAMLSVGCGHWLMETLLPPGTYEYCLVVDGQWRADPAARQSVSNPYGGRNSVLKVALTPAAEKLAAGENTPLKNASQPNSYSP